MSVGACGGAGPAVGSDDDVAGGVDAGAGGGADPAAGSGVDVASGGRTVSAADRSSEVASAERRPSAGLVAVTVSAAIAAGWQFSQWCTSCRGRPSA